LVRAQLHELLQHGSRCIHQQLIALALVQQFARSMFKVRPAEL
jgi:hypothetical protein